jgi:hypothetical protein
MSPLGKKLRDGKHTKGRERRRGEDRRRRERRSGSERRQETEGRGVSDLYRSDLDRHLWSWPRKRKSEKASGEGRSKIARIAASAAGAVGAIGLSWLVYRKLRKDEGAPDPEELQGDLDEADFKD